MYKKILVALENSEADLSVLKHVSQLAKELYAELYLVHVAEGWAARHFEELELKESEEMIEDRKYLELVAAGLRKQGLTVRTHLALGNPPDEILAAAAAENCDLIAMTSHGHRFFADLLFGSTIEEVRHKSSIPILAVSS
jgi:nucleotide-binding universal stress UspA family protein